MMIDEKLKVKIKEQITLEIMPPKNGLIVVHDFNDVVSVVEEEYDHVDYADIEEVLMDMIQEEDVKICMKFKK